MVQTEEVDEDEHLFVNTFGNTRHKKTTLGNQQLYIIGNIYKKIILLNNIIT